MFGPMLTNFEKLEKIEDLADLAERVKYGDLGEGLKPPCFSQGQS